MSRVVDGGRGAGKRGRCAAGSGYRVNAYVGDYVRDGGEVDGCSPVRVGSVAKHPSRGCEAVWWLLRD